MIQMNNCVITDSIWQTIYTKYNSIDPNTFWGDVLYLGMGDCYLARHQSDKVSSTTIIENDEDVIQYNQQAGRLNGWHIINNSVYDYTPTALYDFIVVDIWYDSQPQDVVFGLVNKYRDYLTERGQIVYLKTIIKESQQ